MPVKNLENCEMIHTIKANLDELKKLPNQRGSLCGGNW